MGDAVAFRSLGTAPEDGIARAIWGATDLDEDETQEQVVVPQAGVVLLWPFLPAYLEALGLRREGDFVEDGRERAVHLLHYTATESGDAEEHELVLPKLLYSWPLDAPLGPGGEGAGIGAREKAETDELLRSVITHWSALGSTSPAGLRTSFLHRPGLLALGESPVLHVERRGYDVLLEHLPYALSKIKLSWMTTMLEVEW